MPPPVMLLFPPDGLALVNRCRLPGLVKDPRDFGVPPTRVTGDPDYPVGYSVGQQLLFKYLYSHVVFAVQCSN